MIYILSIILIIIAIIIIYNLLLCVFHTKNKIYNINLKDINKCKKHISYINDIKIKHNMFSKTIKLYITINQKLYILKRLKYGTDILQDIKLIILYINPISNIYLYKYINKYNFTFKVSSYKNKIISINDLIYYKINIKKK